MVHLVAHGGLVDEQQGLGQHGTQAMGTEGAGGDPQGSEQGAGAQPGQADGGGWSGCRLHDGCVGGKGRRTGGCRRWMLLQGPLSAG